MSKPSLPYGLNLSKKGPGNKPQPGKRKPLFGDDDSDDEKQKKEAGMVEIGEFGGLSSQNSSLKPSLSKSKTQPKEKPTLKPGSKKSPISMYGDLASAFTSKKHADTAEELDANIYEYDAVYDSLKPKKKVTEEEKAKKPRIMGNLLAAAAVRKRDATIAEEKRLAKEREAEGDEFADKEKFVTSAYKKQQEENRRLEEEERIREEQEAKKNMGTGMTSFYKDMLAKKEQEHARVMQAVKEKIKTGPVEEDNEVKEKTDADLAREIALKEGRNIAINDDGEVVDKRDLLKDGLNIKGKPKSATTGAFRGSSSVADRSRGSGFVSVGGGKQAMRERQSRMMEAQLEQATKRALEQDEGEKEKIERASKSRKTEGDIISAKERYFARKRQAEEIKKCGDAA